MGSSGRESCFAPVQPWQAWAVQQVWSAHLASCETGMRWAVGNARARVGWVGVVGVALRVEVVEEDIHLVRRQQLCGLHVVVRQARMVRVGVLRIQYGGVRHPARLLRRHLHGPLLRLGIQAKVGRPLAAAREGEGSAVESKGHQESPGTAGPATARPKAGGFTG